MTKLKCFTFFDSSYLKTLSNCKNWELNSIDYNWNNLLIQSKGATETPTGICIMLNEHFLSLRDNLSRLKSIFENEKRKGKYIILLTPYDGMVEIDDLRLVQNSLRDLENHENVAVIRENELLSLQEKLPIFDRRLACLNECPLSFEFQSFLGKLLGEISDQLNYQKKRLFIVDLDDTLWGGTLAEQEFKTLEVGPSSFTSRIFSFVQGELLRFSLHGGLLAICSKNHREEIQECLEKHTGLTLREKHFAVIRAGWKPKPQYVREILNETGITEDLAVFVDDSEFERQNVKKQFPELLVPDLPIDRSKWPTFFRELVGINQLFISPQDKLRTQSIQKNQLRIEQTSNALTTISNEPSPESVIEISLLSVSSSSSEIQRCFELINKTNQFNASSSRISLDELSKRISSDHFQYFSVSYKDSFIDEGIIGVIGLERQSPGTKVKHFLLSCRVLGRNIEHKMFEELFKRNAKGQKLDFEYRELPKNKLLISFLKEEIKSNHNPDLTFVNIGILESRNGT